MSYVTHWRRVVHDYDRVAACGAHWSRGAQYHRKSYLVTCPKCRVLIEADNVAQDIRRALERR